MKRLKAHTIGIDQGDVSLFSDFLDDGAMWASTGPRERRHAVNFSQAYRTPPHVYVSMSLLDIDNNAPIRAEVVAETVSEDGFEIVFRTWADTRIARIRVAWLSIGELSDDEDWELY